MKRNNKYRLIFIITCIVFLLVIAAVIVFEVTRRSSTPSTGDVIIKDHVSVLSSDLEEDKLPIQVADDTLYFSTDPNYPDGEILVAGILDQAPAGFIRRVISTTETGGQYVVQTENAVLTDVFEKVTINRTFALTEDGVTEVDPSSITQLTGTSYSGTSYSGTPYSESPWDLLSATPLSGSVEVARASFSQEFTEPVTDDVTLSGSVEFSIWLELNLAIDHGDVIFGMAVHNETGGQISIGTSASAQQEYEKELFSRTLPNIQFAVGMIPIVITNELQATLEGSFQVEGGLGTTIAIHSDNTSGFQYTSATNSVEEIKERNYLSDGLQWNTEAWFSAEASTGVSFHLITKLYDSTGADLSVGIDGSIGGRVALNSDPTPNADYVGSLDCAITPNLKGAIIVTVPIIDYQLAEKTLFELPLDPLWENHWESSSNWQEELDTVMNDNTGDENQGPSLTNTFTTTFPDVNMITYPKFSIDYPDTWTVTSDHVTTLEETATLSNSQGLTISFSQRSNTLPSGADSQTDILQVELTKVADSSFAPTYVQATDYSGLGPFMVAKLDVKGFEIFPGDPESPLTDGATYYAVVPESMAGTAELIQTPLYEDQFAFDYAMMISVIASSPDLVFTPSEEQEIISILSSFRISN